MDVFNLKYMRMIRFTLRSIGAWPSHEFEDVPATKLTLLSSYSYTCFLCIICCFGTIAQIAYLITNQGILGFIDLGQTYLTVLMCFVYIQRTMLPLQTSYQAEIIEFSTKFHLMYHKNETEFAAKMHNKVKRICEIVTGIQHLQIYYVLVMYNIAPLYSNFKSGMLSSEKPINGAYEHSVYYVLPFDHNNEVWYPVVGLYNFYVSYNLGAMFSCHDLLISVYVFHIWGHLNICEHNLNNFPRPSITRNSKTVPLRYSAEENKKVAAGLKEIIIHYIMIKKFVEKTSNTYSVTLCFYYGFHMVAECILLLQCSTLEVEALAKYGFLTVAVYQELIQLSVVFELIYAKGTSLIDAVYGLPWECMDNSSRRTVLILLQIVQQPLSLKACGMVPVGIQTMQAILKGSFSYFLMLRTFANQ
uniref:Odorant receptor n=1 Tax=Epiphyas postvittana TaxID=65032 RepID=C4MX27_EPIPO|nr:odorant receptor 1 [Epiphyas postvittana]